MSKISKTNSSQLPPSRLRQWWLQSQTQLWAKVQAAGAAGGLALSSVSGLFNDPHIKEYLSYFNVPKSVYIAIATMALITWLAHGRDSDA